MLTGIREVFASDSSKPVIVDSHRTVAWSGFLDEIDRTAAELEGRPAGEPVRVHLPSGISFLSRFLAAAKVGRPACVLHTDWATPELEAALAGLAGLGAPGAGTLKPDGDDPYFYIGFTSGTSGRPKPFVRRQKSWESSFAPAGELFSVEAGDLVFLPGSLQHSHFLFGAIFALNRGAAVRLFEKFDADLLASELRQASRAVLYLVPSMLTTLGGLGSEPLYGVHSVVVSGAKMEAHHWDIARRLFPRALVGELYGASELSFVTVNTEGEMPAEPGYVGRPFPGVELEIRPLAGEAGDGPGLVHVRSPYLFEGYIDGAGIDSPVGDDGFMTVGDIGRLDDRGLSLSGRASNLLITGGKNVHPEEVEAALAEHPAVAEAVVAGAPHERWGEEVIAFLLTTGDIQPAPASLRRHLKERVASYKVPKRWFLVDEIPRTRAGKTDRSRDRLLERATEIL